MSDLLTEDKNIINLTSRHEPEAGHELNTLQSKDSSLLLEQILWNNRSLILQSAIKNTNKFDNKSDLRKKKLGNFIAMDCEFVGVGKDGTESALGRISIVNYFGYVIYDTYVRPKEKVTDWRTPVSGITPEHMKDAVSFEEAQSKTSEILMEKILVGHSIHKDLKVLLLSHPKKKIRDISKFNEFKKISNGRTPGLKRLCSYFLKINIQESAHSSVDDARATMLLYRLKKRNIDKPFFAR